MAEQNNPADSHEPRTLVLRGSSPRLMAAADFTSFAHAASPLMQLAPDIVQRVRVEAGVDADQMLAQLSAIAAEVPGVGDRVLRCLVYLSRGRLTSLLAAAETARNDWRDTIVAAEYEPRSGTKSFQGDYIQVRDFNQPFA